MRRRPLPAATILILQCFDTHKFVLIFARLSARFPSPSFFTRNFTRSPTKVSLKTAGRLKLDRRHQTLLKEPQSNCQDLAGKGKSFERRCAATSG
jgi:hypothetical protein